MESGLMVGLGAYGGEIAALTAALLWAIAATIFARLGDRVTPLVINLTKGFVALLLLLATLIALQRPFPTVAPQTVGFLLLSGALGIGLGDTFYFRSLALIGARRSLLIEALAPPLSAVLALIFLGETLSLANVIGILLTLGGVLWVVSERMPSAPGEAISTQTSTQTATEIAVQALASDSPAAVEDLSRQHQNQRQSQHQNHGFIYGLLAALGQAGGAVLSRAGLAETAMDPLWSTLLRLGAGQGLLLAWLFLARGLPRLAAPQSLGAAKALNLRLFGIIAITGFFSTYLAIWLQQTALKYSPAGIAQALSSTSPLFILPIVVILGERLSVRAIAGVAIAISGIALLFQSGG
jgi:drug/metabolite transporter (DMT)-like permease